MGAGGWRDTGSCFGRRFSALRRMHQGQKKCSRELAERHSMKQSVVNRWPCMHIACMAMTLTIRNVPENVRDELASRAALAGQSLQEYVLAHIVELARKPSVDAWLHRVRARKVATGSRLPASSILEIRDEGRT